MLLYLDDVFADHNTQNHPECAARILRLNELLRSVGWLERATVRSSQAATGEQISRVHSAAYVDQLKSWCARAAELAATVKIEADTVVSGGSWNAATRGAGAAIDATQRVLAGEDQAAFCAIRPPGHHALPDGPMGFCLLNNVAIAAHAALASGAARVLIVDWDVHHGNGTQDTFYRDGRVAFYSIHRSPFYPGTGAADETGSGPGLGWIANSPVRADITTKEFVDTFCRGIEDLAAKVRPQIILLSAGFDAHREDPVGSLCLVEEDFATLSTAVKQLADSYCGGKLVSLLEGGYHLDHMPQSVVAHLRALVP